MARGSPWWPSSRRTRPAAGRPAGSGGGGSGGVGWPGACACELAVAVADGGRPRRDGGAAKARLLASIRAPPWSFQPRRRRRRHAGDLLLCLLLRVVCCGCWVYLYQIRGPSKRMRTPLSPHHPISPAARASLSLSLDGLDGMCDGRPHAMRFDSIRARSTNHPTYAQVARRFKKRHGPPAAAAKGRPYIRIHTPHTHHHQPGRLPLR